MRILFILAVTILSKSGYSQEKKITDELLYDVCKSIDSSKSNNDSIKVVQALAKHIYPIVKGMTEAEAQEAWEHAFIRLQKICNSFKRIIDKLNPVHGGDWKQVQSKPSSTAEKHVCAEFAQRKVFRYLEMTGDTVWVTIENGFWTDHFKDGTFSKLNFKWKTECEFEIEFIESNNLTRKHFSKPGDKYAYQILNKESGFYLMALEVVGQNTYWTFKVHY